MLSHAFHVILAICLVIATWCVSHSGLHLAMENASNNAIPVAQAVEADEMTLRTGDTFWGLHLDGVVPCSSMLVKGGGNLVTFSIKQDHDARCSYHIVHDKHITLHGSDFRLRVVVPDQIHVQREPASPAVVINP